MRRHTGEGLVQCAECHGAGSLVWPLLEDGSGPSEVCGCCRGTGQTTRQMNCWLMRWKRDLSWNPSEAAQLAHDTAMEAKP